MLIEWTRQLFWNKDKHHTYWWYVLAFSCSIVSLRSPVNIRFLFSYVSCFSQTKSKFFFADTVLRWSGINRNWMRICSYVSSTVFPISLFFNMNVSTFNVMICFWTKTRPSEADDIPLASRDTFEKNEIAYYNYTFYLYKQLYIQKPPITFEYER